MARHKGLVFKIAKFVADPSAALRPRSFKSQIRSVAKSMKKVNKARNELFDAQDREASIRARIEGRSPANTAAYEAKVGQKLDDPVARIFYKKLVGVSFPNADGTNRKNAIRSLRQHEDLSLVRDLSKYG